ncbi:MAG: DNA primase [Burkholderiaceae bacterium]
MIPHNFLQDLLARVDIVDVVGRHVQLKRSGANWSGLCPFHAEKSPSFTVSPSKQFYHCFGCGASGDAIRFLTEHTGAAFREAVEGLAQTLGMKIPDDDASPADRERAQALKQHRQGLAAVLGQAANFYQTQLKGSARAVEYLKQRGLTGEIAAQFGMGYAPDAWRGLANGFPNYDASVLEEAGMVIAQPAQPGMTGGSGTTGEGGEPAETSPRTERKRYDRFRDRIMFPIRSVQGDVIGFGGRVLDRSEPKYLNSPETPLFSKGRELYGLFEARPALRERGFALVVEGYMDVVALAQMGLPNAVATLGTACTPEQVQKLFRYTEAIVFSFDGDAAGRRAALRAMQASLPHAQATRSIKFLFLPVEHDPDSYVREFGVAAFESCIAQAVPLSRQIVDAAAIGCELETAEGRARFLANAGPYWSALPEGELKLQMLGELAAHARLETAKLQALWQAPAHPQAGGVATPTMQAPRRLSKRLSRGTPTLLDRALWLLLHRCELWAALDSEAHDMLAGQASPYGALFGAFEQILLDHGPLQCTAYLHELRTGAVSANAQEVLARIAAFQEPDVSTDFGRELRVVVDRMRLQAVEDELKQLFESGTLPPDAQTRGRQLMSLRAELKARFAAPASND